MIEIVSADRCIACDICIEVCPTDVFDRGQNGIPRIARQSDCQTCFMCEAYCPVDALYVSPVATPVEMGSPHADEERVTESGLLGSYRAMIGWGAGRITGAKLDTNAILPRMPPLIDANAGPPLQTTERNWNHSDPGRSGSTARP
jgi:NAD-dependent dihydropyrimidine dehydrogenase PreA subunit